MSQSEALETTDEQIVAMFTANRKEAVRAAFVKYERLLLTIVARLTERQNGEDAIQEAVVGILKSGPPEGLDGSGLMPWLVTCVQNAVRTGFRKRNAYQRAGDRAAKWLPPEQSDPSPEETAAKAEKQRVVHRLVNEELTKLKRALATDDIANDFPPAKEQAAKFGKTENHIYQVRHQYISDLREAIKRRGLNRDMLFWE